MTTLIKYFYCYMQIENPLFCELQKYIDCYGPQILNLTKQNWKP